MFFFCMCEAAMLLFLAIWVVSVVSQRPEGLVWSFVGGERQILGVGGDYGIQGIYDPTNWPGSRISFAVLGLQTQYFIMVRCINFLFLRHNGARRVEMAISHPVGRVFFLLTDSNVDLKLFLGNWTIFGSFQLIWRNGDLLTGIL